MNLEYCAVAKMSRRGSERSSCRNIFLGFAKHTFGWVHSEQSDKAHGCYILTGSLLGSLQILGEQYTRVYPYLTYAKNTVNLRAG